MQPYDDAVTLPDGGPRLALRRIDGPGRPVLLVHGLSSNARTWDAVARRLAAAGHEVVAVDQRGHGRSEQTADGYTTRQCATDLGRLVDRLGFTGERAPAVAGQSWGGNVVVDLAAHHGGLLCAVLVDGGWIRLAERFATFDQAWEVMTPPQLAGVRADTLADQLRRWHPDWSDEALAGTLGNLEVLDDGTVRPWLRREHHRDIVRSLYDDDPHLLYPDVQVPVLLAPAVADPPGELDLAKRAAVTDAARLLPDATIEWYVGADHDLHQEQPDRLAADIMALIERAERKGRS